MHTSIVSSVLTIVVFLWAMVSAASDYPIKNPYLATVVGTPEPGQASLPAIALRTRTLPQDPDRHIPKSLWYGRKLEYSLARQPGPAPLVFAIAGTGGYHNSDANVALLKAFHAAGYHVVGITSPTHPKFIIAASEHSVPGNVRVDAVDLHRMMSAIQAELRNELTITGYQLTGYSLGAIQAAFVAYLDQSLEAFDFQQVVLMNSPLSVYSSISKLDRLLENIPGGLDNFDQLFNRIVRQIGKAYTRSTAIEFNTDLVFKAFKAQPPDNEELAALIGVAFRLATANMIFTADVMTNFGFIKPKEVRLRRNSSNEEYLQVALRVGLTDYFHEFLWPYYQPHLPASMTRADFADSQSLVAIADFLKQSANIHVVHNADDIILDRGEIDFFRETFGDRAKIYAHGGHLGNIKHADTLNYIVKLAMASARQ